MPLPTVHACHVPHLSQVKTTSLDLRAPGSDPPMTEGKRKVLVSGFLSAQQQAGSQSLVSVAN